MACGHSLWSARIQRRKVAMKLVQEDIVSLRRSVTILSACVTAMHKISGVVLPDEVVSVIDACGFQVPEIVVGHSTVDDDVVTNKDDPKVLDEFPKVPPFPEFMQEKLKKSEDITKEDVTDLMSPAQLADEEIMVPVDMRGVNEEFEDVDQMIENLFSGMLGPKGTAEAFVKAHECFKANKDNEPEDERPAPMTAAEWRKILDEQDEGDDGEFGLMEAAEEEDVCDDDAEEDDEPASKKAQTDG